MKKQTKSQSAKRGRQKSSPIESGLSKTAMQKTRALGIFETAKRAEIFGDHPGYVDLKIRLFVYNPVTQSQVALPGKQLEILVGSIEHVDELLLVIRKALVDWIRGDIDIRC